MAVYTKLSAQDVEEFLALYNVDKLQSFSGIEEGIENTNYLIVTTNTKYILTIFETRVDINELPFFITLTDHLRAKGINCPVTLKDKNGNQIQDLKGKKASLISFLEGKGVTEIHDYHLAELGTKVAKMHLAVKDLPLSRKNDYSISRWTKLLEQTADHADQLQPGLKNTIANEIYYLAANWPFGLPGGIIHTDIFPDNVFFNGKKISGIIDFYFACTDAFVYDIAIIFNAWNIHDNAKRQQIFLNAYEALRPLNLEEKSAMPILLRGAALRFLMTRLYDWFNTPDSAVVKKKDPMEYVRKLEYLSLNSSS